MSSLAVTCPAAIAAAGRKSRNRKRERRPEVRALVLAWCEGKICSCGCGKPANTAHHPTDDMYGSDDRYLRLSECQPYYHRCHFLMHRGLVRCPGCGGWMKGGAERCAKCRDGMQVSRAGTIYRKSPRPDRHPCANHIIAQRCTVRHICCHSPKRARECKRFQKRELTGCEA